MAVISKMTFDNGSTKNLIGSTFYGKCSTAAGTAAKTVTIGGWSETTKDNVSGTTVHIYFENENTASNPTLNIDSQGAHKIITSLDTSIGSFSAGVYSFTLVPSNVPSDNTYRWLMQANVDWSNVSNKPSLDFIPTTGGNMTGDIVLLKQVSSGAPGDSYGITFQRGTLTDNYNDWRIVDSGGYLHFYERGNGSTAWNDRVYFNTTGGIVATGQVQAASLSAGFALLTTTAVAPASGDQFVLADASDSNRVKKSTLTFGTDTATFLRNDGIWATPPGGGGGDYIPTSQKGAASGVAELDSNSKLPVVQSNYLYGKCSTTGSTAAKVVTIAGYDETTIADMEGVTVFVAFAYRNTAANPTLNVSGSGAHPIVVGTYQDPASVDRFTNGLHSFTLVKASDNNYYWWINEGRDTVPEAPTTADNQYVLKTQSDGTPYWSSVTIPAAATTGTLTLSVSGWSGNGPYSHSVTISGTTANSKIDLQPDSTVLAQMTTDGTTALYIENNDGTLTAWAMGAAPTAALTIQYTKAEVA